MLEFLKPPFLFLHLLLVLLYINDLPDVICNIVIYADDTALYSKCDQTNDMSQQLKLASEPESDMRHCGLGQRVAFRFQCCKNSTASV